MQRGLNSGLTGFLDLPGSGSEDPRHYAVRVYSWTEMTGATPLPIDGRGGGAWSQTRAIRPGGQLVVVGDVAGYPEPSDWRGHTGTVTLQWHTGRTVAVEVRVDGLQIQFSEKTGDNWRVTLTCAIVAPPVYSANWEGDTEQAVSDVPPPGEVETYEGLLRQIDPDALQDQGSRRYVVWPVQDDDESEVQRLGQLVGDLAPPSPGGKIRSQTITRVSHDTVVYTITWARTTTAEDVINGATWTSIDPEGIESKAQAAAINGWPVPPAGVYAPLETTTRELHDSALLRTTTYGVWSTAQQREVDGTWLDIDPDDLETRGQTVEVYPAGGPVPVPSAPTGTQKVSSRDVAISPTKRQLTVQWGKDTSEQKVEQGATYTITDPQGLESRQAKGLVDDTPTVDAGYYSRGVKRQYVTNDHYLDVVEGGLRTTKDDVEMPATESSYPADDGRTKVVGTVSTVSAGDTAEALASAAYTANKASADFVGVTVKKLTPLKALTVVEEQASHKLIRGTTRCGKRQVRARVGEDGKVQVWVTNIVARTEWYSWVCIEPVWLWAAEMDFWIEKRATGYPDWQWSKANTVNNAPFFGLATETVTYMGADSPPMDLTNNVASTTIWRFRYDSLYHFSEDGIQMGWFETDAPVHGFDYPCWINAELFGWVEAKKRLMADYSPFTT